MTTRRAFGFIVVLCWFCACGGGGGSAPPPPPPPATNPTPAISGLAPSSVTAGAQTLTISASGFIAGSAVTINGGAHVATFVDGGELTVALSAADQATAGNFPVVVTNPAPGGGASSPATFTVNNPTPKISALSPATVIAGTGAQTLTISGSGFVAASTASLNGANLATTFVNADELTAALAASDEATAGQYSVVVTNAAPGGGSSPAATFLVAAASGNDLTLTIRGLPNGVAGNALVSGPNGFAQKVAASTVLPNLAPGTYTIVASVASGGAQASPAYFWPTTSANSLTLPAASPETVTITYQPLAGTWRPLGPAAIETPGLPPGTGELSVIAIDSLNPAIMYIAAGGWAAYAPQLQTGVYKTTDGGTSWAPMDKGLTDTAVQALYLDQSDPNVVLCGTYAAGIFRSADGGNSWTLVANFAPVDSFLNFQGAIYAGTAQGVAASNDDGVTWKLIEATTAPVGPLATSGSAVYAGLGLAPGCYGAVNAPCAPEPGEGQVLVRATPTGSWVASNPPNAGPPPPFFIAHGLTANPANSLNAFVTDSPGTAPNLIRHVQWGVQLEAAQRPYVRLD